MIFSEDRMARLIASYHHINAGAINALEQPPTPENEMNAAANNELEPPVNIFEDWELNPHLSYLDNESMYYIIGRCRLFFNMIIFLNFFFRSTLINNQFYL